MIDIKRHIEILLLSNDCVIIPNFGCFMAHHVDAHYDEADDMFLPPMRTLGFNPQLTINDSLLAQSYVEAYDISYPEAIRKIESEVDELKRRLTEDGFYELNDIGTLLINEEGHYEFHPCEAGILSPSLYALPSFELKRRQNPALADVKTGQTDDAGRNKKAEESISKIVAPADDNPADEENDDEDESISIRVSKVRNVIAIAAAVICFFLFTSPFGHTVRDKNTQSIVGTSIFNKVYEGETVTPKAKPEMPAAENTATKHEAPVRTAKAPDADPKQSVAATEPAQAYSLVLASHVTRRNATEYVNELHHKGFESARLYSRKGVSLKVICGEYATEGEAYAAINKYHSIREFSEAWVMKINKQ